MVLKCELGRKKKFIFVNRVIEAHSRPIEAKRRQIFVYHHVLKNFIKNDFFKTFATHFLFLFFIFLIGIHSMQG